MNYYILTYTKVHHKITQEQRNKIKGSDFTEIELDGQMVMRGNIADILDETKYFETFPDKRSVEDIIAEWKPPERIEYESLEKQAEASKEKLRGLLKSLKQYIDEELKKGSTPRHALNPYNHKLAIYKRKFS